MTKETEDAASVMLATLKAIYDKGVLSKELDDDVAKAIRLAYRAGIVPMFFGRLDGIDESPSSRSNCLYERAPK
jgi:hypothetical protein